MARKIRKSGGVGAWNAAVYALKRSLDALVLVYECGGNVRSTLLSECEKMENRFLDPLRRLRFGEFWGSLETAHPLTLTLTL